jgi:hypothetical protein
MSVFVASKWAFVAPVSVSVLPFFRPSGLRRASAAGPAASADLVAGKEKRCPGMMPGTPQNN